MDFQESFQALANELVPVVDTTESVSMLMEAMPKIFGYKYPIFTYALADTYNVVVIQETHVIRVELKFESMYGKQIKLDTLDINAVKEVIQELEVMIDTLSAINGEADEELIHLMRVQGLWYSILSVVVDE